MKKLLFIILLCASTANAADVCHDATDGFATSPNCTSSSMHVTVPAAATSIAKAEDAASANADTGVACYTIRDDNIATNGGVGTDGDYMPLRGDNNGRLWVSGVYPEDKSAGAGDEMMSVGGIRDDVLSAGAGVEAEGDYHQLFTDNSGALWVSSVQHSDIVIDEEDHLAVKFASIATDGADADDIIAAVAAKRFRVLGYLIACSAATDITFEDGDGTDITGTINLIANGNLTITAPVSPLGYIETPTVNKSLAILKSAAVDCDGHITYIEVD